MLQNKQWQQAFHLFETASDLPPEARLPFLHSLHVSPDILEEVWELLEGVPLPSHSPSEVSLIGQQLGRYVILAEIGRGGMGQVYKACDTRLERLVAIKILPSDMVWSPSRRAMFEREARLTSALNHPNIVIIHDMELDASQPYLVLEFVEGRTLHQTVPPKGLPWATALDYGIQLAQALQAAASASVIHRDLKPSNIMITAEGHLKVLDFGIAKLRDAGSRPTAASDLVRRDNGNEGATQPGETQVTIVGGTPDYMAPEQIGGGRADGRSDIFAFGAVFFFMLTGERALRTDLTGERKARWISCAHPNLNRDTRHILQSCLQTDPAKRPANADALYSALQAARNRPKQRLRWFLAAALSVIAVAAAFVWFVRRTPSSPFGKGPLVMSSITAYTGDQNSPSYSPDGRRIAFSWNGEREDNYDIYLQAVSGRSPVRLTTEPSTEYGPAWSPDGKLIAFASLDKKDHESIKVISTQGGASRKVCDRRGGTWIYNHTLDWSPDSKWLIYADVQKSDSSYAIFAVSVQTGEVHQLTFPKAPEFHHQPSISRDGKVVIYVRDPNRGLALVHLRAGMLPGGPSVHLQVPGFESIPITSPIFVKSNHDVIFLSNQGGVESRIFGLKIPYYGAETQSPTEIANAGPPAVRQLAISSSGHIAFPQSKEISSLYRLDIAPRTKTLIRTVQITSAAMQDYYADLSPDGKRIVFESDRSGFWELWASNADGSDPLPVTDNRGSGSRAPRWSPDGRTILFEILTGSSQGIYVAPADRAENARRVTPANWQDYLPGWSTDGRFIFYGSDRDAADRIYKVPVAGGPETQVTFVPSYAPAASPDGHYVYYESPLSSVIHLYRQRLEQGTAGTPELVATDILDRTFAPTEEGVYFLRAVPNKKLSLILWNPSTRRETLVTTLNGRKVYGLSASRDGKVVLLSKVDQSSGQIVQLKPSH